MKQLAKPTHLAPKAIHDHLTMNMRGFFEVTKSIINTSESPVTVMEANGLPVLIPPQPRSPVDMERDVIIVKNVYRYRSNESIQACLRMIESLESEGGHLDASVKSIQSQLRNVLNREPRTSNAEVGLAYRIPINLLEKEVLMYSPEIDTTFLYNGPITKVAHPRSLEGTLILEMERQRHEHLLSGVNFKIVDNEMRYRSRYMFAANKVFEIPTTKDTSKESGVYYAYSETDTYGNVNLITGFVTMEEAETTFGLYKTREEALSSGNPELAIKADYERTRSEIERMRIESERTKMENDRYRLDKETEIQQLKIALQLRDEELQLEKTRAEVEKTKRNEELDARKHEREMVKTVSDERKTIRDSYFDMYKSDRELARLHRADVYESRSYDRKETVEWLKFIPAVLVGAGAMLGFMRFS